MDSEPVVIGTPLSFPKSRPKTYGKGRVCSKEDCDTILSQYNKQDMCYLHQPVKRPRLRGKMPSEKMEQEEVPHAKCHSCGQRKRYLSDQYTLTEVVIDGVRHYEGVRGAATLCER